LSQIKGRTLFTFAALLFVALLLWISSGYPPRARQVPQVVGWFSLVCLIIQLVLDSSPQLMARLDRLQSDRLFSVDEQVREARSTEGVEPRMELVAFAWLAFFLAGLMLLGFLVFIPVYILCYLRFQAAYPWFKSALYAAATWLFVDLLFVRLFEIRLYSGIILARFFDL
jgi:Tripartite tricarboxylate transporter TctB family